MTTSLSDTTYSGKPIDRLPDIDRFLSKYKKRLREWLGTAKVYVLGTDPAQNQFSLYTAAVLSMHSGGVGYSVPIPTSKGDKIRKGFRKADVVGKKVLVVEDRNCDPESSDLQKVSITPLIIAKNMFESRLFGDNDFKYVTPQREYNLRQTYAQYLNHRKNLSM